MLRGANTPFSQEERRPIAALRQSRPTTSSLQEVAQHERHQLEHPDSQDPVSLPRPSAMYATQVTVLGMVVDDSAAASKVKQVMIMAAICACFNLVVGFVMVRALHVCTQNVRTRSAAARPA